jgi:hypothetical protein
MKGAARRSRTIALRDAAIGLLREQSEWREVSYGSVKFKIPTRRIGEGGEADRCAFRS